MQTEWKEFLLTQGAELERDIVTGFNTDSGGEIGNVLSENTIMPLSGLSILEICGEDANSFMNGQFTTDIMKLHDKAVQLSSWCNPKGRVISIFFIFRSGESYYLFLPRELKESFCKRLQMYILRAAVTIQDRDEDFVCIGVRGDNVDSLLALPNTMGFKLADTVKQRALIFGESITMQNLWGKLSSEYSPVGTDCWQLFNTNAGMPWVTSETSEEYLPQELNLDLVEGLDFNKGCYPGQEIVARVHYRGQVKRRGTLATASKTHKTATASKLYVQEKESPIGSVLNSSQHPDDQQQLFCVIDNNYLHSEKIHLGSHDGALLTLRPLPYSIEVN